MVIDSKLADLLSDFSLDVAKAFFIATFVAPTLSSNMQLEERILAIARGFIGAAIFLILARGVLKLKR